MNTAIPFELVQWNQLLPTIHPGESGSAAWQTKSYEGLRIRTVTYSAGYMADHWCRKGHIVYCLEGSFDSEMENGDTFTLSKGMMYIVSDTLSSHRSVTKTGATLLIIDGDFLALPAMQVQQSSYEDLDTIFSLYKTATAYMQGRSEVVWPVFERSMVEAEIANHQQWKMMQGNDIACVWATAFSDPQIWEAKDKDPAVYIHRIAVHPQYRGQKLVTKITDWAIAYAKQHHKKYVRLDTVGDNKGLIRHYTACGFNFLGLQQLQHTDGLPPHYHNATVSLFELEV